MRVLVDSGKKGGGREHAIIRELSRSKRIEKIYTTASDNPGILSLAEKVPVDPNNLEDLANFAKEHGVDYTIVGPEGRLALGVADVFMRKGLKIFAPTKEQALIETSKAYFKKKMVKLGIPTAKFRIYKRYKSALNCIRKHGAPIVIKASGLAGGKGVYVCKTLAEAEAALKVIMVDRIYGDAGGEVVIEEFHTGEEVSLLAFCDGKTARLMPAVQDHKRLLDGDKGPNTGGKGAVAPVHFLSYDQLQYIKKYYIEPLVVELGYVGVMFLGLMITETGIIVLEINARLGDPEWEVLARLLKTDLIDIIEACVNGQLDKIKIEWHPGYAACVILSSKGYGYPGKIKAGYPIYGLEKVKKIPGIVVYHAGTRLSRNQLVVTGGGRELCITNSDETLEGAIFGVYRVIQPKDNKLINPKKIWFKDMHYRTDIGQKALRYLD